MYTQVPVSGQGSADAMPSFQRPVEPFYLRRRKKYLLVVVLSLLIFLSTLSNASALTIGLMSGDNSWQEESGWNGIQHSGAKIFRAGISVCSYNNSTTRSKIEKMFTLAAERGIKILPYLYGRGSESNCSQQFLAQKEWTVENNAWENFVKNVVWEFGYNGWFWTNHPGLTYMPVNAWEVWNEPNLAVNNPGGNTVQAEEYARFLKRTSIVLKAAQANNAPTGIEVLFGGLYSAEGMAISKFLEEAHKVSETGQHFNGLSLHPYSFQGGLWGVEQYVNDARNQLNKQQWSGKSLWITELGWNVEPWGDAKHAAVFEDQQRDYLNASFNWIKSVASTKNIPTIIWYIYRDNPCPEGKEYPDHRSTWDHHAGLIRANGSFRLAWDAFQAQSGAAPWHGDPYSWHSESLCGVVTSDPDITTSGTDQLDVFARGTDNALWHTQAVPYGWSGWSSLGGALASGPGAAYMTSGVTQVVARGTDNAIWQWWGTKGWWGSGVNLGGGNTSDPDLSSWGSERLDLFTRGSDNALWHRYWTPAGWSEWERIGGSLASGPSAVSWGSNRIDVVARASDGSLLTWYYDGSWHAGPTLSGVATFDPDIASTASGRLTVFIRGTDGSLWLRGYDASGGGWASGWTRIPDTEETVGGPGATSWREDGRLDVVGRRPAEGGSSNNVIAHWWWGPSGSE